MGILRQLLFGLWNRGVPNRSSEGDWEIVQELELFPRQTAGDGSLKFKEGVRVVKSTWELDASKTWVLVHRKEEENEVLAWSPCDGERVMIPWTSPLEGLVLAPGSCHTVGGIYLAVGEEALHVCDMDENGQAWAYSSDRSSWELLPARNEDKSMAKGVEVEELGKVYFPLFRYSPKLKSSCIPRVKGGSLKLHWYKGSLYSMARRDWFFKLFKWQAQHDEGWQEIDSHPVYSHGIEKLSSVEDFFVATGGGRYVCITQVNTSFDGRFIVVYDLEESKWHYRTTQADGTYGFMTSLVCTRGCYHNILDSVLRAVWFDDASLLQLPPKPHAPCRWEYSDRI